MKAQTSSHTLRTHTHDIVDARSKDSIRAEGYADPDDKSARVRLVRTLKFLFSVYLRENKKKNIRKKKQTTVSFFIFFFRVKSGVSDVDPFGDERSCLSR